MIPKINWSSENEVKELVRKTKADLRSLMGKEGKDFSSVWNDVKENVEIQKHKMKEEEAKYGSSIPVIMMEDILKDCVPKETVNRFLNRGAVVVRNVIPSEQVEHWYQEVKDYLKENDYENQEVDPNLDTYFSVLESSKPQIFNIFWSKCQVNVRQHERLALAKKFLNSFWISQRNGESYFIPDREVVYADRLRVRIPGDNTLGLSPHVDSGSIERWVDDANRKVYNSIFTGNWKEYMPYDGAYRNQAENIVSPAVCRAFRTYQGWISLTSQGPGDGTLQLVPMVKEATAYLLLRPFVDDVPEDLFCGGLPGKAQGIDPKWHASLLEGLVSIPNMKPGDTVWWHGDLIHAVEDEHQGSAESSVTYIGSAPWCERNSSFLELQKPCFLSGKSSPDFAPEDREVDYKNRASLDDLTDLGKKQMGFLSWD